VAGCYDHGRDMWQAVMIMVEICGRLLWSW